jgi:adenylate cyclase
MSRSLEVVYVLAVVDGSGRIERKVRTDRKPARQAGVEAVHRLRRSAASMLADALRRDPDSMARAVELGLVRREWLERPGDEHITDSTPKEVLERWLERTVEQRPSTLAALSLSTIQILSAGTDEYAGDGVADTIAVAFTDLENFSAFTAREGDDVSCRFLAEHKRAVGPVVRSRGGRIVKQLGDGLLLTFPNAEAGVLAAVELIDLEPAPLRIRVGLHAGEVLVLPDRDVVGHVVNVAARVAEVAGGGEVLTTEAVRDAAHELPGLRFGRLRRHSLKGTNETIKLCHVQHASIGGK